jgi:hypothetical protein
MGAAAPTGQFRRHQPSFVSTGMKEMDGDEEDESIFSII